MKKIQYFVLVLLLNIVAFAFCSCDFRGAVDEIISDNTVVNDGSVVIISNTPTPSLSPTPTPTATPTPTPTPNYDKDLDAVPELTELDEIVYAISDVNVRAGWSERFYIVGGVYANDSLHRVGETSNGWSKVAYNGGYAYIYSAYLTTEKPAHVNVEHLDLFRYVEEAFVNNQDSYVLPVPCILQRPELPSGGEITCLAAVLSYLGYKVDKVTLADKYLEKGEVGEVSPFEKFVGDPFTNNSYGCYGMAIYNAAQNFLADNKRKHTAYDMCGSTLEELLAEVKAGNPVIVWATTNMNVSTTGMYWTINGETVHWKGRESCFVLIGYNEGDRTVVVDDPSKGMVVYDMDRFYQRYLEQYAQAVVIK